MPPIALLAKKIGMTRIFESDGTVHPLTVLEVGPCRVLRVKKNDGPDGYDALQLGFVPDNEKAFNKPEKGFFNKIGQKPYRFVREVRVDADVTGKVEAGQELTVSDHFAPGEFVDVVGWSKGRGFQGVMRRHGHAGSKESSHGTHEYFRHGGSVGSNTYPGRTMPGLKMPGRMGCQRFTIQNLRVIDRVAPRNLVLVRGAVPGPNGGLVIVRQAIKVYKGKAK
jgi:large subunit ribosomal protein L3